MSAEDCRNQLRFRLNDDSGVLRFVEFEILEPSRCGATERILREYLLGRALADVDVQYLRKLTCAGNGECMQAVIREMEKQQRLFTRKGEDQPATC